LLIYSIKIEKARNLTIIYLSLTKHKKTGNTQIISHSAFLY